MCGFAYSLKFVDNPKVNVCGAFKAIKGREQIGGLFVDGTGCAHCPLRSPSASSVSPRSVNSVLVTVRLALRWFISVFLVCFCLFVFFAFLCFSLVILLLKVAPR